MRCVLHEVAAREVFAILGPKVLKAEMAQLTDSLMQKGLAASNARMAKPLTACAPT